MKEEKTIENPLENVEEFNARTHQNIDRNIILQLIRQLLQLLTSMLQETAPPQEQKRRQNIEKIPTAPEIINPDAPFCEPKDPEIQRAEIAKSLEKTEEKSQEEPEKAQERQKQRQKSQGLTR